MDMFIILLIRWYGGGVSFFSSICWALICFSTRFPRFVFLLLYFFDLKAIFFDKKRIIANAPAQYSNNTLSLSKCNFSIFKKVFSIKEKRILSIEEILDNENLFIDEISLLKRSKDFLLIENTPDEILETCKAFLNYN